jgi:hypothetical protein
MADQEHTTEVAERTNDRVKERLALWDRLCAAQNTIDLASDRYAETLLADLGAHTDAHHSAIISERAERKETFEKAHRDFVTACTEAERFLGVRS